MGCVIISRLFPSARSAPLTTLAQMILYCLFYPGIKASLGTALREAREGQGMSLPSSDALKAEI